ncbi:MAG: hypothetical protein FJ126_09140 [Deltaproteobacteria bacterium]|nr:hypothetical protein [Deltaproteobacteria bacterium]
MMAKKRLAAAVVALIGVLTLSGCAATADLVDLKDYTFQAQVGSAGIPVHFYDNDQSLRHWFTAPYYYP